MQVSNRRLGAVGVARTTLDAMMAASTHLENVELELDQYLPDDEVKHFSWVRMPFDIQWDDLPGVCRSLPKFKKSSLR